MKSPFPYFGGKSRIAGEIWSAFAADVHNYVEPFAGSAAMLLARPHVDESHIETLNDADGFIANFWRAMSMEPEAVAHWADWPVNEIDLHARHAWLVNRRERLTWCLEDPDFYDEKIAGWWVWGQCMWIGSGWCGGDGPWVSDGAHIRNVHEEPASGAEGRGIQWKIPEMKSHRGIHRKRPNLRYGIGIHSKPPQESETECGRTWEHLRSIADRLRSVRVCCGDFERVLGPTPTFHIGTTAVFLDPPYSTEAGRDDTVYAVDCGAVAHRAREWCMTNGGNPKLRIALCGYEGEGHDVLLEKGWRVVAWKAKGGMSNVSSDPDSAGKANRDRERVYLSPACLAVDDLFAVKTG